MPRDLLKRASGLTLDLILPWLAGAFLARVFHPYTLQTLRESVIGHFGTYTPSDFGGSVWFYWWFHEAVSQGKSWLFTDAVCAPEGVSLGNNFPQWIDAALAYPFFDLFAFPLNINLFSITIPIMGAAAAYYGLRSLFPSRLVCLTLALIYGFNPYTYYELTRGRPVTAIVVCMPLFVGAFTMCLRVKRGWAAGIWMALAGAAGALSVYYYVLFAMLNAAFAAVSGLHRTFRPFPGLPRRRAPVAMVVVAALGILFSMGYIHQLIVLQPRLPGRVVYSPDALKTQHIRPFWDPQLWRDLETAGYSPEAIERRKANKKDPGLRADWVINAQSLSLPYYALWRPRDFGSVPPEAYFPWIVGLLALVLAPLGGRRGVGWLLGAAVYASFTLGPYLCLETQPPYMDPVRISGHLIPGPLHLLYRNLPETSHFFWPYRVYPMALFCLLAAIGSGWTAGLDRFRGRAGALPAALSAALMGGLILHIYIGILHAAQSDNLGPISLSGFSPFLTQLAEEEDVALIELPFGAGRFEAEFQLLHGQRRADNHQDYIGSMADEEMPPAECFQLPLLQALWALGLGRSPEPDMLALLEAPRSPVPEAETSPQRPVRPPQASEDYVYAPSLGRAAVAEAVEAGFGYLIVYHQTYWALRRNHITIDRGEVVAVLAELYGPPVYEDATLTAWDLRALDLETVAEEEPTLPFPVLRPKWRAGLPEPLPQPSPGAPGEPGGPGTERGPEPGE